MSMFVVLKLCNFGIILHIVRIFCVCIYKNEPAQVSLMDTALLSMTCYMIRCQQ